MAEQEEAVEVHTANEASAAPSSELAWTEGMDDVSRGFIENKGWTEPGQLLSSYRHLEQMTGVPSDRVLQLPKDAKDAKAWGEVYDKMGRPEKPGDYTLEADNAPQLGDEVYNDIRTYAHEAGLTDKQFTDFYSAYEGRLMSLQETQMEKQNEAAETDMQALSKEWGQEYDANIVAGKRAVQALELDNDVLERMESAMGTKGFIEHFTRIGRGMGEDKLPVDRQDDAVGTPFGMTPAAAKAKIEELTLDTEFMGHYMDGKKAAVDRMTKLHNLAHPDVAQE